MIRRALLALVHGWLDAPAEIYRQATRADHAEANLAETRRTLTALRSEYEALLAFTTSDTAPIETAP